MSACPTQTASFRPRGTLPLALAVLIRLLEPARLHAEDRVEYRYEEYKEDDNRMDIRTHAVGYEMALSAKVSTKGLLVYDSISGATPTGEAPPTGSNQVPLAHMHDIRRAATLNLGVGYGKSTTTPEFSYSEESDYISRGVAITQTLDLNQKNTTLVFGVAHNFDSVGGGTLLGEWKSKDTTDFMLGVNQLLSPRTVFTANLTLGYADGYMNDPYRLTTFLMPESPDPIFSDPANVNATAEQRPGHKFKQVAYTSINQFVTPLDGAVEASYRFYHDDWGIFSHTASVAWLQKIGRFATLSPFFRYYWQSAADFYAPYFHGVSYAQYADGTQVAFQDGVFLAFAGDPEFPTGGGDGYQILNVPARPAYYSSDYRLSELESFTYGITLQVKIADRVSFDFGYRRYEMNGLDGVTPKSAYPSAHVFTVGCGIWF